MVGFGTLPKILRQSGRIGNMYRDGLKMTGSTRTRTFEVKHKLLGNLEEG